MPALSRSFSSSGWRGTGGLGGRDTSLILVVSQAAVSLFSLTLQLVVGTNAQTPPAEGVFFAQPVTILSSDSESDIDTDDAQTVIFKSSPYSSPGPGIIIRQRKSKRFIHLPVSYRVGTGSVPIIHLIQNCRSCPLTIRLDYDDNIPHLPPPRQPQ